MGRRGDYTVLDKPEGTYGYDPGFAQNVAPFFKSMEDIRYRKAVEREMQKGNLKPTYKLNTETRQWEVVYAPTDSEMNFKDQLFMSQERTPEETQRYLGIAPETAKSFIVPHTAKSPIFPPGKKIGSTTYESVVNARLLVYTFNKAESVCGFKTGLLKYFTNTCSTKSWDNFPPLPCPKRIVLLIFIIPVISCTSPFIRYHACSNWIYRCTGFCK